MRLLLKFVDLVLYSNLFIALGALALTWQVEILLGMSRSHPSNFAWFVFCSTLFVYAAHRIIGFTNIESMIQNRRLEVIREHDSHIKFYAVTSLAGIFYFAFQLPLEVLGFTALPTLLSLAYIAPIFRGKRFRDLPFVKVFTVGLVWMWLTVCAPLFMHSVDLNWGWICLALEKFLFITAITIPFDIRDLEVDRLYEIKTIPSQLGAQSAIRIAQGMLVMATGCTFINWTSGNISESAFFSLLISYIIIVVTLSFAREKCHDYYFSGILDGTIILQFTTVLVFTA